MVPSWDGIGVSWRHVASYLVPCLAISSDLGGSLWLSEALLEPSWAILDAPAPRETFLPGSGGGGRGMGILLLEGEEGGWKEEGVS